MLHPWEPIDWVGILEAIYDLEQPREQWLGGVLRAAEPLAIGGGGIGGVLYETFDESHFQLDFITGVGLPPGWLEVGTEIHTNPAFSSVLAESYRRVMCASSRVYLGGRSLQAEFARGAMVGVGLEEALCVNGLDGSGFGCALYLFSKESLKVPAAIFGLLQRIASHLATAYRLHRRLAGSSPSAPSIDAVVGEQGQVLHAEREAKKPDARSSLIRAAKQYRWAHGAARREQPAPAVQARQALVAGRWTLREHSDADGKTYLHAHANQPLPAGPRFLSVREQQVAVLAALGRSNKLIAYELGLAHSTVRVLMARAAQKLGAQSRSELVAALAALGIAAPRG